MRVVLAPDKFKGSLSAAAVVAALATGIADRRPDVIIDRRPMADGGEGTVQAALAAGFQTRTAAVTGSRGQSIRAAFAVRADTAIVELATASGLAVLPARPDGTPAYDPLRASSHGTGELVRAALDAGCRRIVLAVGGSASTDGGAGLLTALGVRVLDASGRPLPPGGGALVDLDRVDLSGLDPRLEEATVVLAADVTNPLLGPAGAAAVFAPQKGARPEDVRRLEAGLTRWADRLARAVGAGADRHAGAAGAGAAGGVGFAALAVLGAERRPGVDVVADLVGLDDRLAGAAAVITGEGSLDHQSLGGKVPVGVAARARSAGVPLVLAVCGRTILTESEQRAAGFDRVLALLDRQVDPARSMREAAILLRQVGSEIAGWLPSGCPAQGGTR